MINLCALLSIIDSDVKINIQLNHKEIFDGPRSEYFGITYNGYDVDRFKIKSVWYSTIYNRIMIEL